MVGPGYRVSGRSVIARAYPAAAALNDNIWKMSTDDTFKISCDLYHVYRTPPPGELASFDNRQHPHISEDFHRE